MIEIKGKYQTAKVFTDYVDEGSITQIIELLNQEAFKDSKVRIMPDVHLGKGCVIGFTADLGDYVIPNLIGVDIGCGMLTLDLGKVDINLEELDSFIRNKIPYGNSVSNEIPAISKQLEKRIEDISKKTGSDCLRNLKSIGSLGSGNHFIEISKDKKDHRYLVIHSGSRNFGLQVAKYHQKIAEDLLDNKRESEIEKNTLKSIICNLKKEGRIKDIEKEILKIKENNSRKMKVPKELSFLIGKEKEEYLRDMKTAVEFASENRKLMANKIINHLKITPLSSFETIHNYIGDDNIIRKGSISAKEDELVLIPINMRDGCIIAKGKGNSDWNNSAPHGAGRLLSRTKAKDMLNLKDFQEEMKGIFSSCVSKDTLDESPMAYKPIEAIIENIQDTADIIEVIKPIYNFKA